MGPASSASHLVHTPGARPLSLLCGRQERLRRAAIAHRCLAASCRPDGSGWIGRCRYLADARAAAASRRFCSRRTGDERTKRHSVTPSAQQAQCFGNSRKRSRGPTLRLPGSPSRFAAIFVVVVSSLSHSEEQQPQTTPTRDVDITYQITRLGQPAIVERRRWLASLQLRRVDGRDKSATIFDQNREELTLLNAANHTYRTVEWPVANRMSPKKGRP